jgi:aryl-alcohol dehydrogenase-like predicted oxidoreductase
MAYVFAQPMNLFALAASRSVDEFAQNLGAMEVRLSPEEIRWLAGAEEKAATAVERPAAC